MPMVEEEMIKAGRMIEKAYDYSRSYPDGEGWLDSCVDAYRVDCAEDLEKSDYGNKIDNLGESLPGRSKTIE